MPSAEAHELTQLVAEISTLADAIAAPVLHASPPITSAAPVDAAFHRFVGAWAGTDQARAAGLRSAGERVAAAGMAYVEGDMQTAVTLAALEAA